MLFNKVSYVVHNKFPVEKIPVGSSEETGMLAATVLYGIVVPYLIDQWLSHDMCGEFSDSDGFGRRVENGEMMLQRHLYVLPQIAQVIELVLGAAVREIEGAEPQLPEVELEFCLFLLA